MRMRLVPLGFILVFILLGCKFEGEYEDLSGVIKFFNSYIVDPAAGVADGSTELEITVYLLNSDGSPQVGVVPNYSATWSMTHNGCSATDANGKSVCRFTSSSAGSFVFRLTDVTDKVIEKTATFNPSAGGGIKEVISGAHQDQTGTGGYKVGTSIGNPAGLSNPKGVFSGTGGYKIYVGVQTGANGN